MVATTVAVAAILLANVPREVGIGEKVDEGVDEGEDEGEDVGEDVGGEADVIETRMNIGSKDTAFTKEDEYWQQGYGFY